MSSHGALRSRIATLVWLVAMACALILAVGALLVALRINGAHPVVALVEDGARLLDLGTLDVFDGSTAPIRNRLTSWGVAAVAYLVAGKTLDWIIRPRRCAPRPGAACDLGHYHPGS